MKKVLTVVVVFALALLSALPVLADDVSTDLSVELNVVTFGTESTIIVSGDSDAIVSTDESIEETDDDLEEATDESDEEEEDEDDQSWRLQPLDEAEIHFWSGKPEVLIGSISYVVSGDFVSRIDYDDYESGRHYRVSLKPGQSFVLDADTMDEVILTFTKAGKARYRANTGDGKIFRKKDGNPLDRITPEQKAALKKLISLGRLRPAPEGFDFGWVLTVPRRTKMKIPEDCLIREIHTPSGKKLPGQIYTFAGNCTIWLEQSLPLDLLQQEK